MILLLEPISNNISMYVPAYPLPLLEIASFVKKQRPEIDINVVSIPMDYGLPLTPEGKQKIYNEVLQTISSSNPKAVGLSCTAISQAEETIALCESIKKMIPDIFIFLGGYFPTLYYEEVFEKTNAVDVIVLGEGELPALGIVDNIEAGKDPRDKNIPGLVWQNGTDLIFSVDNKRFDLNQKAVLEMGLLKNPRDFDVLPYSFSRGCPYKCNFCMEDYIRPSRKAVPRDIIEEDLRNLEHHCKAKEIIVCDALFNSFDVTPVIRDLGMKIHFETRSDVFDPQVIPEIHDICGTLVLGFESASFSTLSRMSKVSSRKHYERYLANTAAIFRQAAEYKIPVMVFMIAGYPGDTEDDLIESYNFAKNIADLGGEGGHIFKIGECRVYPKTKIHELAKSLPDVVFDDDGVFGQNVVRKPSKHLDFQTVLSYMDKIYRLSNNTEKLQKAFLKMVPFFRLPATSLLDKTIPETCYRDSNRDVLKVASDDLHKLREVLSVLRKKKKKEQSGERAKRVLTI